MPTFDGRAKRQRMETFPETLFVVHINDFNAEVFSRVFQACSVNAWGGSGKHSRSNPVSA
jgi:hypothetical protein